MRKIARPGKIASHQTKVPVVFVALASSLPQLAWPSGPRPRKLSVASARIAAAIANEASTRTGVTPLGSMCLKRIDRSGRPTARADCTKSWFRMRRNSARMNRAAPVQLTQPMIAIIT